VRLQGNVVFQLAGHNALAAADALLVVNYEAPSMLVGAVTH